MNLRIFSRWLNTSEVIINESKIIIILNSQKRLEYSFNQIKLCRIKEFIHNKKKLKILYIFTDEYIYNRKFNFILIPDVISLYVKANVTLVEVVHSSSLLIIIAPLGCTESSPIVSENWEILPE